MDERDDGPGRQIRLPSAEQLARARERERKRHMLKRLADALGRPVEIFFTADTEVDAIAHKADGDERG